MDARRLAVSCLFLALSCKGQSESVLAPPLADAAPAKPLAALEPGQERTAHGVVVTTLQKGTGTEHPGPSDYVEVRYSGYAPDGGFFEGSGNESAYLDMGTIVPGLSEGLARMVDGDKVHLWVPADQAYGPRADYVNAPREEMTFDVELVRVIRLPPVPSDLTSPPSDAKKTSSGLVYKLLSKGPGKVRPSKTGRVEMRYSIWTSEGKLIENSYLGPGTIPAQIPRLLKGWGEALPMMVEGDKMRLWLPAKLAFGEPRPDEPNPPPFAPPLGPIVIDVELVKILTR